MPVSATINQTSQLACPIARGLEQRAQSIEAGQTVTYDMMREAEFEYKQRKLIHQYGVNGHPKASVTSDEVM
jgi:hypothetical protein